MVTIDSFQLSLRMSIIILSTMLVDVAVTRLSVRSVEKHAVLLLLLLLFFFFLFFLLLLLNKYY